MTIYVTGTRRREHLEALAFQLRGMGHRTVVPFDVLDDQMNEMESLWARLRAVLDCDMLVTSSPSAGDWSPGATKEVAQARLAEKRILAEARIDELSPNHHA